MNLNAGGLSTVICFGSFTPPTTDYPFAFAGLAVAGGSVYKLHFVVVVVKIKFISS